MNFPFKIDWFILIPAFFLFALGVMTLYSVSPELVNQQLFFGVLGLITYLFFSSFDYQIYKNLSSWFYVLSLFFLVLTEAVGVATRGSIRWLDIGIIRLQPSELIKPLMVIFLATNLENKTSLRKLLLPTFLFFLPVILILRQPDLGNAMVFGFVWLTIFLISDVKPGTVLGILTAGLGLFWPVWYLLKSYQKQRIITFLNPGLDPLGTGYNTIQSTLAVGSGELLGRGLGRGTQSHLKFLPEFHTDFIFASFAEEWGFIGVVLLLTVFAFLLWYLFKQSQPKDQFTKSLLTGIMAIIFLQMFVNIGMNMGLAPITGITLPLVSYGGSSLISTAILLGIASNITQQKTRETNMIIS